MLNSIATRLSKSVWLRHLFFMGAAFLAISLVGYFYGTFDQAFHIPFLKKFADPSLYPGDAFLDLRFYHYSFFWFLFEPFYKINLLEPAMFAVHFLATYATFWMFWELSNTLFNKPLTNLLVTTAFIFPHTGLSGFQVIEYSLLNRSFVFPFLLGSITLYLKRRYWLSFLILGLMYNLHVLSVNYVMAMIVFDAIVRFRQVGWWNLISGLSLFIIGALPILIWRTGNSSIDLSLRPDLLSLTAIHGPLYSVYYWISSLPQSWLTTLCGFGELAFFIMALRRKPRISVDRIMINFIIAIGIVVLIETITTYWLPITFLLQMQLLRIGQFLLIIGYLYFANFLADEYLPFSNRLNFAIILSTFITFISPILVLIIWTLRKWCIKIHWRQVLTIGMVLTVQVIFVVVAIKMNVWSPGIHIYPQQSTWSDVQNWAKENTPINAHFITPPQIFWPYTLDWRVVSERSTLATIPEMEELIFVPSDELSFKDRFEAIAPGALEKFDGYPYDDIKTTGDAFYSMTAVDFLSVAQKYNISYLVVEKPHTYPFTVVYENKDYIVYNLAPSLKTQ